MPSYLRFAALVLALLPIASVAAESRPADARTAAIAALLRPWDRLDSPGAIVSVMQDGREVASVAVGAADLEHGAPITRDTVFHAASLSKQVTAFAVLLLEMDGRLSIDDPLSRYVPEAAGWGPITLRQLLNHTSGLREQFTLLGMAGWRAEDLVTNEQVLALILAQRGVNAPAGAVYQYINTDYTLLAEVVRRVSGETLDAFCRHRIFEPLAMRHTRFRESVTELIPDRAESYRSKPGGGFTRAILNYAYDGPTNLQTTAEDLQRWAGNFEHPRVGDVTVRKRMEERGVLKDGTVDDYAMGQDLHAFHGYAAWMHGGRDAGFRTFLLRVPSQRLSVVVLSNVADFNSARIAAAVADLYLKGQPGYIPDHAGSGDLASAARLKAYAGVYELFPGMLFDVSTDGRRLFMGRLGNQQPDALRPLSASIFEDNPTAGTTIEFPEPASTPAQSLIYRIGLDGALVARRVELKPFAAASIQPQEFAGRYYASELKVVYDLIVVAGQLVARSVRRPDIVLRAYQHDTFTGTEGALGRLIFGRSAHGEVNSFLLSGPNAENVAFKRISLP